MGWFWADAAPAPPLAIAPHPLSRPDASPPPGCPMHKANPSTPASTPPATACPYPQPPAPAAAAAPSYISKLNPLNHMPASLANTRAAPQQSVALPLSREPSSIPRGDRAGTWDYPSPQQMYNALLRKGYADTPAEHVEAMVAVHNFLNEGAWAEIRTWEALFARGLAPAWTLCREGEANLPARLARADVQAPAAAPDTDEPRLLRFEGRPDVLTPKARMLGFLARVWPSRFPDNPPFDRHDWYVQRAVAPGEAREIRYVIDYYAGPPEPTGEPVFFLDVRPALDGPTAVAERALRWGGDVWYRASGGSVREELQRVRR